MTMRVTQQTISTQVLEGLQRAYQQVARSQEIVTTGRRINHLSDDPLGTARAFNLRAFEDAVSQYSRNIDNANPFLAESDAVLGDVVSGLTRAKELALSVANDTNTQTERSAAADEIHEILQSLLGEANTQVDNRYLFGGFLNGAAPFVQGPSGINYVGDNGEVKVQTSATNTLTANLIGSQVFQGASVTGGQGVFDTLQDLEAVLRGTTPANALSFKVNLDENLTAGAGFAEPDAVGTEAAPATLSAEADFSTVVTVFDANGQAHDLHVLFAKTGAATFNYRVFAESDDITGGTPGNWYQVGAQGTLAFNPDGSFNAGGSAVSDITLAGLADGAADITIAGANIAFTGSTQKDQPSAVIAQTQTNTTGLQTQLGRLDAALNQVSSFRAVVGARQNSAQVSSDALTVLKDRATGLRSQIEDADVIAAYSDFARFQNAFQAALQSAAQVIQPTLLDFLT